MYFLYKCLFLLKFSTLNKVKFAIIFEFSYLFKFYNFYKQKKNQKILYLSIKYNLSQKVSKLLETLTKKNLRL